jgi:hypothetical protein
MVTTQRQKVCHECPHVFQGKGWTGIDSHWKAHHEKIMPYKDAWPLIRDGLYPPDLAKPSRSKRSKRR